MILAHSLFLEMLYSHFEFQFDQIKAYDCSIQLIQYLKYVSSKMKPLRMVFLWSQFLKIFHNTWALEDLECDDERQFFFCKTHSSLCLSTSRYASIGSRCPAFLHCPSMINYFVNYCSIFNLFTFKSLIVLFIHLWYFNLVHYFGFNLTICTYSKMKMYFIVNSNSRAWLNLISDTFLEDLNNE